MNTRRLRWLAVVLPLIFMVGVIFLRFQLFPPERSLEGNFYAILAVALGATIFSIFIFNVIEHREEEVRQRSLQLEALHEAALALTNELDLQVVLQKVVDLSRSLLNAKYGALGVLDQERGRIEHFFTSGLSQRQREKIGAPPKGRGLLGVLSPGGQPLIVDDIAKDQRSAGFPPNHPKMRSLLGVPIKSKGEIFGNLYLADKLYESVVEEEAHTTFTESDRQLLEKFATQAAIAIENAQLYRKTQELAVLQERERFSMDLHDGIMQSVYATGLSLQEVQRRLESSPQDARERIDQAINDLSQVLRDIRNYILGLRPDRFHGQDLLSGLGEIAQELHGNTLLNVSFETPKGDEFSKLPEEQVSDLLHIAQEALTNVRKHAHARNVSISLGMEEDKIILIIEDDGVGFDLREADESGGNGLRNMRERTRNLNGEFSLEAREGKGTRIRVALPVLLAEVHAAD